MVNINCKGLKTDVLIIEELRKKIGMQAVINCKGLKIDVLIIDVRVSFGRIDFKVTPVSGSGTRWMEKNSLFILTEDRIE